MKRALGVLGALAASACTMALANAATAAPFIPPSAVVAATAGGQAVKFDVILPLTNKAALATLLTNLQNPGSPSYHKFLTPAQFNAQFGPSAASVFSLVHLP